MVFPAQMGEVVFPALLPPDLPADFGTLGGWQSKLEAVALQSNGFVGEIILES